MKKCKKKKKLGGKGSRKPKSRILESTAGGMPADEVPVSIYKCFTELACSWRKPTISPWNTMVKKTLMNYMTTNHNSFKTM